MDKNVVIAGYARSPFHFAGKGELASVRPDDLAATVVAELVKRTGIDPAEKPAAEPGVGPAPAVRRD